MAVRLIYFLVLFGLISFSYQKGTDWDAKLVRDSRDLHRLQNLLSKLSRPQPKGVVSHKERYQDKSKQAVKQRNEREEIKHLLDDLEREIKKNYQPVVTESNSNEAASEENKYESNSGDSEEAEEPAPLVKNKPKNQDSQYSDLLSLLRCSCGFEAGENQALRCASCNRPKVSRSHSSNSQSEHLLTLLNRYGKKYKLSDELDAIVIDVSNLEEQANKPKNKKRKVSPLAFVDPRPQSSNGLDRESLKALEYLLQPQDQRLKAKHTHTLASFEDGNPQ